MRMISIFRPRENFGIFPWRELNLELSPDPWFWGAPQRQLLYIDFAQE